MAGSTKTQRPLCKFVRKPTKSPNIQLNDLHKSSRPVRSLWNRNSSSIFFFVGISFAKGLGLAWPGPLASPRFRHVNGPHPQIRQASFSFKPMYAIGPLFFLCEVTRPLGTKCRAQKKKKKPLYWMSCSVPWTQQSATEIHFPSHMSIGMHWGPVWMVPWPWGSRRGVRP